MRSDFLFELGTEELPSRLVDALSCGLYESVKEALAAKGLSYERIKRFATPRRLAILIEGLANQQPAQKIERRGPSVASAKDKDGNPSPALQGFARGLGVEISSLSIVETEKGAWYQYEAIVQGESAASLMPELIDSALQKQAIPKPMRWGAGQVHFARPVHWVVMMQDNAILPCKILGVQSGDVSYGHRFLAPQAIRVTPSTYEAALERAFVVASFEKRRDLIVQQLHAIANPFEASIVENEDLVDEVCSIVEWPNALRATFDETFLQVPAEVLIESMQSHQKCFALKGRDGKLTNAFVTVSNIAPRDPTLVVNGNEKVMRARLSDAAFFYFEDLKIPLESLIEKTQAVIFEKRLGSIWDKTQRVAKIARAIAPALLLEDATLLRAVSLSKCDLLTAMVGEFPDLQGLMGQYYAASQGEDNAVAQALYEQYLPRFAGDSLPETGYGLALSLAERIDTLVGIFAIGLRPTGVKDPYKLRRHALAVVRLIVETQAPLSLTQLLEEAMRAYEGQVDVSACLNEVRQFILERMFAYYEAEGIGSDKVLAVRDVESDRLAIFHQKLQALLVFLERPAASALAQICKRVNNLLNHAKADALAVSPERLTEEVERALYHAITTLGAKVDAHVADGAYLDALLETAAIQPAVDAFFEQVMVMVEDIEVRDNRLALLMSLREIFTKVANFSLLQ